MKKQQSDSPQHKGTFPDTRSFDKWVNNYALEHDKKTFDEAISYFKFDSMQILQDDEIRDNQMDEIVKKIAEKSSRYKKLLELNDRNQRTIWTTFSNILEKKCKTLCLASDDTLSAQLIAKLLKQNAKNSAQKKSMTTAQKLSKKDFESAPSVKNIPAQKVQNSNSPSMDLAKQKMDQFESNQLGSYEDSPQESQLSKNISSPEIQQFHIETPQVPHQYSQFKTDSRTPTPRPSDQTKDINLSIYHENFYETKQISIKHLNPESNQKVTDSHGHHENLIHENQIKQNSHGQNNQSIKIDRNSHGQHEILMGNSHGSNSHGDHQIDSHGQNSHGKNSENTCNDQYLSQEENGVQNDEVVDVRESENEDLISQISKPAENLQDRLKSLKKQLKLHKGSVKILEKRIKNVCQEICDQTVKDILDTDPEDEEVVLRLNHTVINKIQKQDPKN